MLNVKHHQEMFVELHGIMWLRITKRNCKCNHDQLYSQLAYPIVRIAYWWVQPKILKKNKSKSSREWTNYGEPFIFLFIIILGSTENLQVKQFAYTHMHIIVQINAEKRQIIACLTKFHQLLLEIYE